MHRAAIYKILSLVYLKEPTEEMLKLLEQGGIKTTEKLEDLTTEYTRLFIGPAKHLAPYGSIYRKDDQGKLWGETTAAVKNFIEATGLKFKSNFSGMPDHISAEFEFMQKLIEEEAKEGKPARKIQEKFFKEHVLPWVPLFCEKVKDMTTSKFYKDIASLTGDFILQEKEVFEDG